MKTLLSLLLLSGLSLTVSADEARTSQANAVKTSAAHNWVCRAQGRRINRGTTVRRGHGATKAQAAARAKSACEAVPLVRMCTVRGCWQR